MSMIPEIKAKWLEALRGVKYKQGIGHLRGVVTDPKPVTVHCCLGVLCDLVAPDGWDGVDRHRGQSTYPSYDLLNEIDLDMGDASELAAMNDDGKSFAEIADHIEANL